MTCEADREELLPCPFCGGPVQLEKAHVQRSRIYGDRQFWGVVCRNTSNLGGSCCMDQVPSASKEAAIGRWNRRATAVPPGMVVVPEVVEHDIECALAELEGVHTDDENNCLKAAEGALQRALARIDAAKEGK